MDSKQTSPGLNGTAPETAGDPWEQGAVKTVWAVKSMLTRFEQRLNNKEAYFSGVTSQAWTEELKIEFMAEINDLRSQLAEARADIRALKYVAAEDEN